jgi:hypothetical protein
VSPSTQMRSCTREPVADVHQLGEGRRSAGARWPANKSPGAANGGAKTLVFWRIIVADDLG